MDRLDGAARLMIVSDLDSTMVDHLDPENLSLLRFNALWEAFYRDNSLLVYSTGRSPKSYKQLKIKKPLLTPDVTIMSVGTEIMYGESMVPDAEWECYLNQKWNRDVVTGETAKFPELTPQPEIDQRPHKVSFYVKKDEAMKVMKDLPQCLEKYGLDVKIIYSSGIALDVLPRRAGKGQALAYLLKKFKAKGRVPSNTLVCGDSGNDAELFTVPAVHGVMVSNAQEELLEWYSENAKNNHQITHATERCAAGIIQAIGTFSLGPNVSPRDIRDFLKCTIEMCNPCHEVVKFYLFYERWRRGEVERSDHFIDHLRLLFNSLGTFVHPSGIEIPFSQCIDEMANSYGDQLGKQFRLWVDRVSVAQICSDTWLVKFDKCELCGKDRECRVTTVLLSSRHAELPGGFMWIYMHQTWLDGSFSGGEDQRPWLF
ncbi:sucrose-phosphatase 2-like isoform X1 [Syzygium oleosum]|uniref:sucrose-phosphatase 2-like isoform X1 n=2 Tax=Syzygium oleosum TaxID=219896 RepID=UPI0011D1A701|nr:sucrose-phosphatase 2-like isoform X1 [Syzygium oleosum]XP_056164536.1 sucrose-phosphatase 2-like isoform X1 [Syzygium oleosum]XP_056164537.1 sucrose-phosphatase 2-like isoform X1 [Syzygium oleosum]XP_056164538.1 sucrose-phosphatase 2-like isoform X1 [Syzygium oleosum]XP_056164539.1 sucrose-phosphatase 2-like isoform X1 [Syzygium oleosum]XP_056164540.1 sucrose-phosphatase 2-like isoform X1 [Syzygium oleosum]XP_056164541.1 sucrose-phosphatase 2-like isoform X1 [Syzygium oleosum]